MASSSSSLIVGEEDDFYGGGSGWVEARTSCEHLPTMSNDLIHIPPPDSCCSRCHHPSENWLCLGCKDVLCSRFINKHMLNHHKETGHSLALSYSPLDEIWNGATGAAR
ncbi:histone deacetylase-like protein isoform X2 [Wolffia australiana]